MFKFLALFVCAIATLTIVFALIFSEKFRKDILGGEGEANVFGILSVQGTAVIVLSGLFLAGLIITSRDIAQVAIQKPTVAQELCFFNESGEPVGLTTGIPESLMMHFGKVDSNYYQNTLRTFSLDQEKDKLYIRSQKGYALGHIPIKNLREKLQDEYLGLTSEQLLRLGLYYKEHRQQSVAFKNLAAEYLLQVLKRQDSYEKDKEEATQNLHFVVSAITDPRNFDLLIENQKILRSGPSQNYEIAETYRFYLDKVKTEKENKKRRALYYYMCYLNKSKNDSIAVNSDKFKQVQDNCRLYIDALANTDKYFKKNAKDLKSSISNPNWTNLEAHIASISERYNLQVL